VNPLITTGALLAAVGFGILATDWLITVFTKRGLSVGGPRPRRGESNREFIKRSQDNDVRTRAMFVRARPWAIIGLVVGTVLLVVGFAI
jgi:hypothetical protein